MSHQNNKPQQKDHQETPHAPGRGGDKQHPETPPKKYEGDDNK